MWTKSKLDKKVTVRWNALGRLGEKLAKLNLQRVGFTRIRNLNEENLNNCFADIYAVKDKQAYIISVKARNKFENNGNLNSRYKLGKDCYPHAELAEAKHKAKAAWIAIAIDVKTLTYDAYFGLLSELGNSTGISMSSKATSEYVELAIQANLIADSGLTRKDCMNLENTYERK